jgi:hypothetical protein
MAAVARGVEMAHHAAIIARGSAGGVMPVPVVN